LKNVLKLCSVSIILLLISCAHKKLETGPIEMPSYEGIDLKEALASMNKVSDIETKFSIVFEKNDTEIRGDGALNISGNGDMSLRLYSLGFLVMELTSGNGEINSSPRLDGARTIILTQGLRDCLFWWDIKDFNMQEEQGNYLLKNSDREIWIDKKTFLPKQQDIYFDDGRVIRISYDEPAMENGLWYQSRIRIELAQYSVILLIRNMAFQSKSAYISPKFIPAISAFPYLSLNRSFAS
jgi:hypothetical protein